MKVRIKKLVLLQVVRQVLNESFDKNSLQIEQLPRELVRRAKRVTQSVDPKLMTERLPDDYHITVVYGSEASPQQVRQVFERLGPVQVSNQGRIGYFDNQDSTVAYIPIVKSPGLQKLVEQIQARYGGNESYDSWQPHITLAYLIPGTRLPESSFKRLRWNVNRLQFSHKSGRKQTVAVNR